MSTKKSAKSKSGDSNVVLQVSNVGVLYSGVRAIENINFDVKNGEFFGLIGVNGAGKTTLIKTLLGLRDADEGSVQVLGERITQNHTSPHIAFLPERFEPSWFLSGMEFLHFSTGIYGSSWKDADFELHAEKLRLDPSFLKKRVQTYSKGMRQKLGLLATIMTNAKVLILDEPMSGLDPAARTHVKDLLMDVKKQRRTVLVSSHILSDMEEMCDRICLINDKALKYLGTPEGLIKETSEQNLERAFLHFVEEKVAA